MRRRTFLSASAVGTAGVGLSLLGVGQALAAPVGSRASSPGWAVRRTRAVTPT
ncbi:twin-arginine translocation signal domain-containing protein [Saccharothrix yanglingensis]|uniref:twin-arginine translocation signal domain-containing protein n=1 Tax=Saccharothrix yanglingensis TaxID=659496 RepID=UPI0027D268A6|nr:twin-arginine translocation signal domain-containing protein [Saccharothrix yanglingensis]